MVRTPSGTSRFSQVTECNMDLFRRFYHGMLDNGVYLAPSAFEAGFLSTAHSEEVLDAELPGQLYVYKGVMSARRIVERLEASRSQSSRS